MNRYLPPTSLWAATLTLALASADAVEMGPAQIHGSLSGSAAYSDKYNFYGETADAVDYNATELTLNATYRWENGLRAGAQIYAYDIAGYSEILLDWANLDYALYPSLGFRVGRNKLPQGLYNDTQDLDQVRILANLPLGFYPKTYRSILNAYDGLGVYGLLPTGSLGSVEYQVFGGRVDDTGSDTFLVDGIDSEFIDAQEWNIRGVYGAHLSWNTPLDGFRAVASYTLYPNSTMVSSLLLGPGMPPVPANAENLDLTYWVGGLEYTWGNLTLAAEAKWMEMDGISKLPPMMGGDSVFHRDLFFAYLSASYQVTERIGLAAYYGYEDDNHGGSEPADLDITEDWCAAISYSVTDWWILKFEAHWMDGIGILYSVPDENTLPVQLPPGAVPPPGFRTQNDDWLYFVLKTTLSF